MPDSPEQTVALTHQIDRWLQAARFVDGDARSSLAVDLADILAAAEQVKIGLGSMLALDPGSPGEADRALRIAGVLEAYLFTEMKAHLETLEQTWPLILDALDRLGPPSSDSSTE